MKTLEDSSDEFHTAFNAIGLIAAEMRKLKAAQFPIAHLWIGASLAFTWPVVNGDLSVIDKGKCAKTPREEVKDFCEALTAFTESHWNEKGDRTDVEP